MIRAGHAKHEVLRVSCSRHLSNSVSLDRETERDSESQRNCAFNRLTVNEYCLGYNDRHYTNRLQRTNFRVVAFALISDLRAIRVK